jgi:hypothetical protein
MMAEKWPDVSTEGQGGLGIGGQTNESKVSFDPQSVRISCRQESSFRTFSKYDWRILPVTPSTQKSWSLVVGNATRTAFRTATRSMIS